MKDFSILDLEGPWKEAVSAPDFWWDLNLDQLLEAIRKLVPGYDVGPYFYRFPETAACEEYRRQIYGDVKNPEVYESLDRFCALMRQTQEFLRNQFNVVSALQKDAWYAAAVCCYCRAVEGLREDLSGLPVASRGLKAFEEYLKEYSAGKEFQDRRDASFRIRQAMEDFQLVLVIENNRLTVTPGRVEGAYEEFLGEGSSGNGPFGLEVRMSALEEEIFNIYRKKYPELFEEIGKFARSFPTFLEENVKRFEKEIQYYLAFYRFEKRMQERGFVFCVPERREDREMGAAGLYDLALAHANSLRGRPVVSNDFVYHEGESFFVVSGPNQGGKTTFARSLGQLVYFGKMGLDVPAGSANLHEFSKLLTHFSMEESMTGGRGRLMEELKRLAPMMENKVQGAFVIINELFTTAAHYDGSVMGARVLRHFMGNRCRGVYVTHLKELGNAVEGVVTMTAMLEEGDAHKRTYQILRHEALDVGYAEDIVEKYGLTYEALRKRLEKEKEGWR